MCVSFFVYIRLRGQHKREMNRNEKIGPSHFSYIIIYNFLVSFYCLLMHGDVAVATDCSETLRRSDWGKHSMGVNNTDVNAFVVDPNLFFSIQFISKTDLGALPICVQLKCDVKTYALLLIFMFFFFF